MKRLAIATLFAAGWLALAWPAAAEIVYTKVNINLGPNSSYNLDVNNDGVTDFTISTYFGHRSDWPCEWPIYDYVFETPVSAGADVVVSTGYPARLIKGDQIGPSQTFGYGGTMAYFWTEHGPCEKQESGHGGNWYNSSGYLGLMFQINGETYYGWAHLQVGVYTATLTGYGYENTPGTPINAGQTKDAEDDSVLSPDRANPGDLTASVTNPTQPVSLGMLALAAPIRTAAQDHQGHNQGHARYQVKILGTLGGTYSSPNGIGNNHWATGQSNLKGDETTHAVIWQGANWAIEDLGSLGGPNSAVLWSVNDDRGFTVGASDTSNTDPYDENFCNLSPSGSDPQICLGFLWQNGRMTPLATLGGNNSYAIEVNDLGQVAGTAENSTQDPNCVPPQVFDWEAVIWGPREGEIHRLLPLPGDVVAAATAINDQGQAVGGSNPVCIPVSGTAHAVLWENGSVTDLGNLGGVLASVAFGINERGHVVGISDLAGDVYTHAFLWTKNTGMQDLGTVSGDVTSFAYGINNKDQVVGDSCPENAQSENDCSAFLWENGVMTDLNTLIPPNSSVHVRNANQINEEGEISCTACALSNGVCTSDSPPVLLIPTHDGSDTEADSSAAQVGGNPTLRVVLPENVRQQLQQRRVFSRSGAGVTRLQ